MSVEHTTNIGNESIILNWPTSNQEITFSVRKCIKINEPRKARTYIDWSEIVESYIM